VPWKALSPAAVWPCRCVGALDKLKLAGDEQIGVNIVKRAPEPLRQISPRTPAKKAQSFSARSILKDANYGFNALTSEYEDLVKAGVLDPTRSCALPQNAG
jgi:chaperonin GroEL